jgi:copper chaperone CopZ
MKNKLLLAILLMSLLTGCLGDAPQKLEKAPPPGELRQATLKISGMTCPACPQTIKTALLQLEGVVDVEISLKDQRGTVVYDASKITAEEIATSKIFSWGVYTAEVVDDNWRRADE